MSNGNSEVVIHKVIGVKTDCPYFNNVGNLCARVDGMARCDEYPECEFKYIDVLKKDLQTLKNVYAIAVEDNKILQSRLKKIKEVVEIYRENCKIEGNCLDERLCSTCYFGGGLEVCDDILDIIEGVEQ